MVKSPVKGIIIYVLFPDCFFLLYEIVILQLADKFMLLKIFWQSKFQVVLHNSAYSSCTWRRPPRRPTPTKGSAYANPGDLSYKGRCREDGNRRQSCVPGGTIRGSHPPLRSGPTEFGNVLLPGEAEVDLQNQGV